VVFHQETVISKGNTVRSLDKIIAMLAITATMPTAPAIAQGANGIMLVSLMNKQCATGYNKGMERGTDGKLVAADPALCYPASDNPPLVYQAIIAGGVCVDGYFGDLQSDWCTNRMP
jgi:hypothetical protein